MKAIDEIETVPEHAMLGQENLAEQTQPRLPRYAGDQPFKIDPVRNQDLEARELAAKDSMSPSLLPRALRYIGAITLGLSALSFAVQRVGELDSLGRFYSFLGFTAVLAACGFLCGLRLKEDKGARTFLGISLVFLPALFLQLGGMIYFILRGTPPGLPRIFTLSAPDALSVGIAMVVGVVTAVTIMYIGFSALLRSRAGSLVAVNALGLAALILPTRNVDQVALILLSVGMVVSGYSLKMRKVEHGFQTFEGKASLGIISIPLVLLLTRTMMLYNTSALLFSALFVILGAVSWGMHTKQESRAASTGQVASLCFYAMAWTTFCGALLEDIHGIFYSSYLGSMRDVLQLPLVALPIAFGLAAVSSQLGTSRRSAIRLAGMTVAYPMAFQMVSRGSIGLTTVSMLLASLLICSAYLRRDRSLLFSGLALVGTVMVINLHYALDLYRANPWLVLGLTGGAILMSSSFIESNLPRLIAGIGKLHSDFDEEA